MNNGSVDRDYSVSLGNDFAEDITILAGESKVYDNLADETEYTVEQKPYDNADYAYIAGDSKTGVLKNSETTTYTLNENGVTTELTEDEFNTAVEGVEPKSESVYEISGYYDGDNFNTDYAVVDASDLLNVGTTYIDEPCGYIDAPAISGPVESGSFIKTYTYTATYTYNGVEYSGTGSHTKNLGNRDTAVAMAATAAYTSLKNAENNFYLKKADDLTITLYNKVDVVKKTYTKTTVTTSAEVTLNFETTLTPAPTANIELNYSLLDVDGNPTANSEATFGLYSVDGTLLQTATQKKVELLGYGYFTNSFTNISSGVMPGTQYYVQQITTPENCKPDTTQYFFMVNRDGSVSAIGDTTIASTTFLGKTTNTLYNSNVIGLNLFTNEKKPLEDMEILLTSNSLTTTYNREDADNSELIQSVIALIDEENSTLPELEKRNYKVEYTDNPDSEFIIWKNLDKNPIDAGEYALRLTISGSGYNPGTVELNCVVNKANACIKVNSATIEYGQPCPSNLVETDPTDIMTVQIFVGLNADSEEVVAPYFGIVIPELSLSDMAKYPELTLIKGLISTNVKIEDLEKVLEIVAPDNKEQIEQIFSLIPSSVKNISIKGVAPSEAGLYLVTALNVDKNYYTSQKMPAIGSYAIKLSTSNKLEWNTQTLGEDGNVIDFSQIDNINFNATMFNEEPTGKEVKYSWLVCDYNGKLEKISTDGYKPDRAGVYVQTAYVLGSELAAPIVRNFVITKAEDVTLSWVQELEDEVITLDKLNDFDFSAVVTSGEVQIDAVTYQYIGQTESGEKYNSKEIPTVAGKYEQIAVFEHPNYTSRIINRSFILEAPIILGDLDNDGAVTINDVTFIQKYLVELMEFDSRQLKAADFNQDGVISISDTTSIQSFLVKIN